MELWMGTVSTDWIWYHRLSDRCVRGCVYRLCDEHGRLCVV